MGLLAASALWLHKLSGAEEFVIGIVADGRYLPEFFRTPGMFANTLPLKIKINRLTTIEDILRQIKIIIKFYPLMEKK